MKLVFAELRKLSYSKSTYGLTLASIFIAVLSTVVTPLVIDDDETGLFGSLQDQAIVDAVFANAVSSYIFASVFSASVLE